MPVRQITTRNATITLRPPGIVWVEYREGAHDTMEDAHAHIDAQEQVGEGRPRPTLVDIRPMAGIDREARAHYTGPHGPADAGDGRVRGDRRHP